MRAAVADCHLLYMTIVEALLLFHADWTCGQKEGGIQSQFVTRNGNLRHIPERRIGKEDSSSSGGAVKAERIGHKLPDRAVGAKSSKKALRFRHLNVSRLESETACREDNGHDVMCQKGGAVLLAGPPSCPLRQVTSPGYPTAYPANRHCNVTLKSPGFALRLWFSFFQLEEGHDWLQISEEGGSSRQQVRQMQTSSGRDIPPPFLADSGQVTLLFHSDEDVEEGGFVLHYESIVAAPSKSDGLLTGACPRQAVLLADAAGTITSAEGSGHKLKCRWRIEAENDKTLVRLHVSHANIVAAQDSLTITTDREIVPVIGQPDSPLTLYSLSRAAVEFVAHSLPAASAFRIDYDVIRQNTSTVVVRSVSGVLQSPGYPLDYPLNQRLTWMVRGSPGGTLLRIIDLQLEGHQSQDHLLIAQGDNLDKGIVTTLFGNVADLTSSVIALPNASTFIVHFHSNYHSQPRRGWLLTFQPLSSSQQPSPSLHGFKIKSHHGSGEEALDVDWVSPRRMLTSGQPLPAASMAPGAPSRLNYPAGYASPASSSAFSLRGVGTFSTVPLMELDVQPFHPQQDWQGDLKECLGSLLPRSILRAQRKPVLTTTVLEWRKDDVVRVMITTSEGADDLVLQLKNALSTGGRVRCNDSLEMYLPDILRDVHSSISGQNWLLASVCIIAFFLIIFSAVLFVHCKQRRVIVRKLRSSVTSSEKAQLDTVTADQSPSSPSVSSTISSTLRCAQVLSVAMEPAIQRNPLYDLPPAKQAVWDNQDTLKDIVQGNMLTRKCSKTPSPTGSSNVVFRQAAEESMDLMEVLRMYPQRLSRAKSGMGGTVINQEIPSLTKGYDVDQVGRKVTMGHARLVEEDETESTTRSVGSPTSFDCQLEAETGETLEVCQEVVGNSEESLAIAAAITQLNEWRNGKPMTVRAVKQKNLLKKQIRQEIFEDFHLQKAPEDKGLSA